jgi:hypothetical protein
MDLFGLLSSMYRTAGPGLYTLDGFIEFSRKFLAKHYHHANSKAGKIALSDIGMVPLYSLPDADQVARAERPQQVRPADPPAVVSTTGAPAKAGVVGLGGGNDGSGFNVSPNPFTQPTQPFPAAAEAGKR